jgi:hypothetical protein
MKPAVLSKPRFALSFGFGKGWSLEVFDDLLPMLAAQGKGNAPPSIFELRPLSRSSHSCDCI